MKKQRIGAQTRDLWKIALFAALLGLAVGWIVFDHLFAPLGVRSLLVEIPDFRDMRAEEISADGWMELEVIYRYDPTIPEGRVVSQTPVGGSRRKLTAQTPRVPITLVVSLGAEARRLEDLRGWDVREAEVYLRERGFGVQTRSRPSPTSAGTVLDMQPAAETLLSQGEIVTLTISEGERQTVVTVPDLKGLSRSDALIKIWLAQLAVEDVVEIDSDEPSGTVVGQSHRAGTRVKAATKITLYVSRET